MAFTMGGKSYGPIVWHPPVPVPGDSPSGPASGGGGTGAGGVNGQECCTAGPPSGGGGACIAPLADGGVCASRMNQQTPTVTAQFFTPTIGQLREQPACKPQ